MYIRKKIREIVLSYNSVCMNYTNIKSLFDESIRNFRRKQSVILEYNPVKPRPPSIFEEFTNEVFASMIHQATRDRCIWSKFRK